MASALYVKEGKNREGVYTRVAEGLLLYVSYDQVSIVRTGFDVSLSCKPEQKSVLCAASLKTKN